MTDHRTKAAREARRWLSWEPVYLDTETTGLDMATDQLCEIAVIDTNGEILLDTLVKPTIPIPDDASRIHGITDDDVQTAPGFEIVWPALCQAIASRPVVIYNANYDWSMIHNSGRAAISKSQFELPMAHFYCAMELYAKFHGDWSSYHRSFRWQRLGSAAHQCKIQTPANLHRAAADAELTRQILVHMANHAE